MNKLALLALAFLASCNKHAAMAGPHGPPHIPNPPCQDFEPNETIQTAKFVQVFTPPDHIVFCGNLENEQDSDCFHFFTPSNQLTSMVIGTDPTVPIELFIYSHSIVMDNVTLLLHVFGNTKQLVVLDFPTVVEDDGFYIQIKTPAHISRPSAYNVEMWSNGSL